jgi:hypothetical protein
MPAAPCVVISDTDSHREFARSITGELQEATSKYGRKIRMGAPGPPHGISWHDATKFRRPTSNFVAEPGARKYERKSGGSRRATKICTLGGARPRNSSGIVSEISGRPDLASSFPSVHRFVFTAEFRGRFWLLDPRMASTRLCSVRISIALVGRQASRWAGTSSRCAVERLATHLTRAQRVGISRLTFDSSVADGMRLGAM